ncbi:MAG TPA: hypothetical protein PKY30_04045 [Myxococcota bacterium]|nr:hypothetical protein [Myxococcota bacterium]
MILLLGWAFAQTPPAGVGGGGGPATPKAGPATAAPTAAPATAAATTTAPATAPGTARSCEAVLTNRQPELVAALGGTPGLDWCDFLAREVYDRLRNRTLDLDPGAAMVINPLAPTSGATGGPGQVGAAPSSAPASTSAVSLGLAGTPAGPRVLASLSFNPLAVGSVSDTAAFARWTRFWDVTVLVPMDPTSQNVDWAVADYVGVRTRMNLLGPGAGDVALAAAKASYEKFLEGGADFLVDVTRSLQATEAAARDVEACATAIEGDDEGAIATACAEKIGSLSTFLEESRAEWKRSGLLVNKKDLTTFGLDVRADFGDPTFTGGERSTSLMAGLAGGTGTERVGLSARLGAWYRYGWEQKEPLWAVDGGLALSSHATVGPQRMDFSIGAEGRYAQSNPDALSLYGANYLAILIGTTVPITNGAALGIGLTVPVIGEKSPQLTLRGDILSLIPK